MRARVLIPILLLLLVFCGALGFAVYTNISSATYELLNRQIDDRLNIIENEILATKNTGRGLSDSDYQEMISGFGTTNGGVFVVNEDGVVIADTQSVMDGMSVASSDWYVEARRNLRSEFDATYGGTEVYAHSIVVDGKLIVSYLSSKEIDELMITPLYVIGVTGIFCLAIIGVIIYFLITRLLINPIESLDEQIEGLSSGQEIELKPLKACPEVAESAIQLNKQLELQESRREHLKQILGEGTAAAAADQATSFDFVSVLREVFNAHRSTIAAKSIDFSMLIDNDMPQVIICDRSNVKSRLNSFLHEVLDEAIVGSKVEARVKLLPLGQTADTQDVAIAFDVSYNGREDRALLEAKRG